jgi:eukaryotic-like serine/threonine-protein kinase
MTEQQRQSPGVVSLNEQPQSPLTISEDGVTGDHVAVTISDSLSPAPQGGADEGDDLESTLSPEHPSDRSARVSLAAIAAYKRDANMPLSPTLPPSPARPAFDSGAGSSDAARSSSTFAIIPDVHYRIDRELARGGMGRILLAHDHRLKREVAIKELLLDSSPARRRFKREALITARLQHPSIVNVYEAGCWPSGEHFYAMEKVNGRSLQAVIDDCHTLQERLALLPRVIDVTEALAYAHSKGVIHRDLKPDNILVGLFGETVVIDWGLAKDLNRPDDEDLPMQDALERRRSLPPGQLTMVGSIMGTPGYMAPEQAEGQEADFASDVYAIGAILYHLLCGEPPFKGDTSKQVLMLMLGGPPPPLAQRVPELPPDLISIVDKAMQRDPTRRYHDAGQLSADLRRFETGKLVDSHAYSPIDHFKRWVRRYRTSLAILSAALLTLILFGVFGIYEVMQARDDAKSNEQKAIKATGLAEVALQRLASEHDQAVQARSSAEIARADALSKTNEVVLHEARAALNAADPARALAWLRRLSPDAHGWDAAHLLASDAWSAGSESLILRGHVRHPQRVAITRDARWIASSGAEGDLRLWDTLAAQGAPPAPLDAANQLLALDPFGEWIAAVSASNSGRVAVLDRASSRLSFVKDIVNPEHLISSPDGRLLAAASADGKLVVFTPSASKSASLKNITRLSALTFEPSGQWLATATSFGTLTLWSTDSKDTKDLPSYPSDVHHLLFSPDGAFLLALGKPSAANAPLLINARTQQPIPTPNLTAPYVEGCFSDDSRVLALATGSQIDLFDLGAQPPRRLWTYATDAPPSQMSFSADRRLLLWRTQRGLHAVIAPTDGARPQALRLIPEVRAFQVAADSDNIAILHTDRSVRLLNLRRLIQRIDSLPVSAPVSISHLPDRAALIVSRAGDLWRWSWSENGALTRLDTTSRRLSAGGARPVLDATLSADHRWLLMRRSPSSGALADVEVWSLPSLGPPSYTATLQVPLSNPTFLPSDPPRVAFLDSPRRVRVTTLDRPQSQTFTLPPFTPDAACTQAIQGGNLTPKIKSSPDGLTLAVIHPCEDALWLVDMSAGEVRGLELPGSRTLSDAVFTPDGRALIIAAAEAGTLRIDRTTWRRAKLFENAHDGVTLSLSPSGRFLTADTVEGTLRIWDLLEDRVASDLPLPSVQREPLLWSPDSRWLVTTHADGARVWGVFSGDFRTIPSGGAIFTSLSWADDGRTLLSASNDNTLRTWRDDLPFQRVELHAWLQAHVQLDIDSAGLATSLPTVAPAALPATPAPPPTTPPKAPAP